MSLETYKSVIKGSNHSAVVVPGDPQRIPLIRLTAAVLCPMAIRRYARIGSRYWSTGLLQVHWTIEELNLPLAE